MQVDLKSFCADVRQAEPENVLANSGGSEYLIKNLFLPYMAGKEVRLGALDYDRFTYDDLTMLDEFIGDVEACVERFGPIGDRLKKCAPAARKKKGFC